MRASITHMPRFARILPRSSEALGFVYQTLSTVLSAQGKQEESDQMKQSACRAEFGPDVKSYFEKLELCTD